MKKHIVLLLCLVFNSVFSKDSTYSLSIDVNKLRNSIGVIQFSLYNQENSIPDENYKKFYKQQTSTISHGESKITFFNLPMGKYAINILHDENLDGKIDKGFIFPKEGIGFSHFSSIGLRNKPNFKAASFMLDTDMKKSIKVIYF